MEENKIVNGTFYDNDVPDAVINVLEDAYNREKRVRLFFGDKNTGKDWLEMCDIMGYICKSNGQRKIPILLHNIRSVGGLGILASNIVKITIDKKVVYKHPKYHLPQLEIKPSTSSKFTLYADDVATMNCESKEKAERLISFLKGERNAI